MATNTRAVRLALAALTAVVGLYLTYTAMDAYDIDLQVGNLNIPGLTNTFRNTEIPKTYIPQDEFPETRWIKGVAGFNYFHNLYLSNGTFILLTSDPSHLPEQGVSFFLSNISDPDDKYHHHLAAGDDRFLIVSPEEARENKLLRPSAIRKAGVSMFFNEVREGTLGSFLDHYYHFIGEMFLGAWRVVASAGETELPARLIYRANGTDWRDRARITTWFQQAVFPDTLVEESTMWDDRLRSRMTFVFDKIAITDRWAAHRVGQEVKYWNKANADLPLLETSKEWMEPIRKQIKRLVMAEGCSVQRAKADVPVVLYINRQLTGRRLVDEDAADVLREMNRLDAEGLIEFHNGQMEKFDQVEQFCLALKADIMFGVHGNGLSHQLWMKPNSAVLEIMDAPGFARDYAILAELMGHEYYAIHQNHTFPPDQWRRPDGWSVGQTKTFHSSNIRVDAKWLADFIVDLAKDRVNVVEPFLVE